MKVFLGYEVGTGNTVEIPLAHTIITGLTHESGKTTALTALIKRSGLKAIIFKTKIGEKAITEGITIHPFFKEEFDWEYAVELLEASRKEKLKFERSWIIKYSRNSNSIIEFKKNIDNALVNEKLRELDRSVLLTLQAYLEKILPELSSTQFSKTLNLHDGINIMDLEQYKEETQSLIIRSVLNEVLKEKHNTLIVIPECWRYLPEKINTPVKKPAEKFIRQGATNNNYLLLDSQDVTGVSKIILKQASNWILGYQREINEIERTLDQLPLPKKDKPKPEDIATLKLGHFFVATSEWTKKVYVQPIWVDSDTAIKVSKGIIDVKDIKNKEQIIIEKAYSDIEINMEDLKTLNATVQFLYGRFIKIDEKLDRLDEDRIIQEVLKKFPSSSNTVVYQISPLEKIKKDFLEDTKQKILLDISKLTPEHHKIIKFVESSGKGVNQTEIVSRCFFLSATSGGSRQKVLNLCKEIEIFQLIRRNKNSVVYPNLKDRIKDLLQFHGASEKEIEQVYNHILFEIINK